MSDKQADVGKVITTEEVRQLIAADKLERERNAAANIQKALEADRCVLHTVIEYGGNGQVVNVSYKTVAVQ